MKLTVFQSDKGDCLMLESADGKRMVVDGGTTGAYRDHVAPTLGALRQAGETIDLIYLSHIDDDHIAGILELLDNELDWRVHDFQVETGNDRHRAPKAPRPPEIGELWHNGFGDLLKRDVRPITELLAATAGVLDFGAEAEDPARARRQRDFANSVPQGTLLSRRVGEDQLGIPLNRAFNKKLALVRDGQSPVPFGSIELTVIGPFEADLKVLRKEWNDWLKDNQEKLAAARARMRADVERLGTGEVELFRAAIELQAAELGDRTQVTAPNLASLMLLAEEGTKTILLTGDGHATDILNGLEHAGRLDATGAIHVDVLKLQHHGSEFNLMPAFCRSVTADHYVICANGEHDNPDLRVLGAILDSRVGPAAKRSSNAEAGDPFKLWFNSSPTAARIGGKPAHMSKVKRLVQARARRHPGRIEFAFLDDHFFELEL